MPYQRNTPVLVALALTACLVTLVACGGHGSSTSSGYIQPAPDPTCGHGALATPQTAQRQTEINLPGVIVPSSTANDPSRAPGSYARTNHLVLEQTSRAPGPQGFTPAQIRTAYNIPADRGQGAIAIVDAYHYSAALNDFNVFSSTFGLTQETSTDPLASTNTIFQVVYATGSQPAGNSSWNQEAALDVQWAHAMAPNAKIYLVESKTESQTDMMAAVDVAMKLPGVKQVSISFALTEHPCLYADYDHLFNNAQIETFAASGDTAGELDYPSLSRYVISVGGTTLKTATDGTRTSEKVWSQTGGGESQYSPRPAFQDSVMKIVKAYRSGNDVAAVADPYTGVSVYDSIPDQGVSGWLVIGGTSAATPIVAGIANASHQPAKSSADLGILLYGNVGTSKLYDIFSGKSGTFAATYGWDIPSGVGVPNGFGSF